MIFTSIAEELKTNVYEWEVKLGELTDNSIISNKNRQGRTIKQIIGHMVDSASNNTHRIVHLQYQKSPVNFPNYATFGNNDKWIAIQNYQDENWKNLIQHWKYIHLHFIHVIQNIDTAKLEAKWIADENKLVSLKEMIEDFQRHFKLHISEIEELINY